MNEKEKINLVFNGKIELMLKVLMILATSNSAITIERITAYDLMTIYSKEFGLAPINLHGNNTYSIYEYSSRRKGISDAIPNLIANELITVLYKREGTCFKITHIGRQVIESLDSTYKKRYIYFLSIVLKRYAKKKDSTLFAEIQTAAFN